MALDRQLAAREVEIDVAEDGCLATLRQRLEETQYHAVLLSMYGTEVTRHDGKKEWGLLFEAEETWRQRPVAGSELAQVFDGLPGGRPGLIVLAACRSAKLAEAAGALQGVALELHQVGLERVLGMRLSVLDQASSVFTASFFGALAHGAAVRRALSLARREMASGKWYDAAAEADPFAQWSLPVLYERTTDGPLVAPPQRQSMTQRRPRAGSEVLGGGPHPPAAKASELCGAPRRDPALPPAMEPGRDAPPPLHRARGSRQDNLGRPLSAPAP